MGEEELGAELLVSSSGGNPFRVLVVGPPKAAAAAARRVGGIAVSNFLDVPPEVYEGIYAVHASGDLSPLLAGARVVLYIRGPVPPPAGTRLIVLTCSRDPLCGEADCICGGALRI